MSLMNTSSLSGLKQVKEDEFLKLVRFTYQMRLIECLRNIVHSLALI
jgi:hypothetical protein